MPAVDVSPFRERLTPVTAPAGNVAAEWATASKGPAREVPRMMYEATKIPGVFERVPEPLRGVFWMRGNGVAEELVSLQGGLWADDERTFMSPLLPFSWAWPSGKPQNAPAGGIMYGEGEAFSNLNTFVRLAVAFSYSFSTCAQGREFTAWGAIYCDAWSSNDLAYAYMQTHPLGVPSLVLDPGAQVAGIIGGALGNVLAELADGAFTLQELPGSVNGSLWRRTCQWGLGKCAFLEFGSYDLVKIIDGAGAPLEPYFSEFVDYMGEVPLMVWSGFYNETVRALVAEGYKEAVSARLSK